MIKYSVILIFSIAITAIHRAWNSAPVNKVDWFIYADKKQDVQWYIKDTFDMISAIIIVWVLWSLSKKLSAQLADTVLLILIYKLMGFAGYWINFNMYDFITIYMIIPIGIVLIYFKRK